MSATFQPIKPWKNNERFTQWKPEGLDKGAHFASSHSPPIFSFFVPLFCSEEIGKPVIKLLSSHGGGQSVSKRKWHRDHDTTSPLLHVLKNGTY